MSDLRIDPEEARTMNDAVFIDTRNPHAWREGETKLPGAIRIPVDALDDHEHELERGRTYITYCT